MTVSPRARQGEQAGAVAEQREPAVAGGGLLPRDGLLRGRARAQAQRLLPEEAQGRAGRGGQGGGQGPGAVAAGLSVRRACSTDAAMLGATLMLHAPASPIRIYSCRRQHSRASTKFRCRGQRFAATFLLDVAEHNLQARGQLGLQPAPRLRVDPAAAQVQPRQPGARRTAGLGPAAFARGVCESPDPSARECP